MKGLGPGRPRIERPELDASLKGPWVWDGTLEGCGWAPGRPGRQLPPQPSAGGFQRRAASPPLRRVSSGHIPGEGPGIVARGEGRGGFFSRGS